MGKRLKISTLSMTKLFRLCAVHGSPALALTLAFCCAAAPLPAQSSDTLYRGTWQVTTPDQGSLLFIVKKQGRAAYFWGDNADRTVYQGTWVGTETAATLTWADRSQHVLERSPTGFTIRALDADGAERYRTAAQQVPKEILGQWAKPPTQSEELVSDRDKANSFFGMWKVGSSDATAHYVSINADRSAASSELSTDASDGLRGSWAKQGGELHIVWDNGHYSILREGDRGFSYKRIASGVQIDTDSKEFTAAARTHRAKVPVEWMRSNREGSAQNGGIAFSSRKAARQFYRGSWVIQRAEDDYEQIEIGRFGGLKTSRDEDLKGDWLMSGQDIFMRWDDGMRAILSPVGQAFVLYSYKPGRPLDGIPTRVLAAAPADTSKLAEHLRGREAAAQHMLELAEAAGISTSAENAGWGRSFMRWAWPFDSTAEADATEESIADDSKVQDPWWWPFWSEAPAADNTTENPAEADAVEPAAPEASGSAGQATGPSSERKTKKSWLWPF